EYYNLPSPRMQKQYRFYVDNGADMVVGHHTHCISGMEMYNSKPIYYSLGNFLFTKPSKIRDWYKGMVLKIEIVNSNLKAIPIFVEQSEDNFKLSFIKDKLNKIEDCFFNYSEIIKSQEKLNISWNDFINKKTTQYLNRWSINSFISNKLIKGILIKLNIDLATKKGRATLLNLFRCEAHRDLSKVIV